jgi:hypothetical protein
MLAELLRDALGVDVGDGALAEVATSFADLSPASYAADLVLSGIRGDLIVELQLRSDDARAVGAAGLVAAVEVRRVDEDRGKLCFDAVLAAVGAGAGEILEAVMKAEGWEPQSEIMRNWMRDAREEGVREGETRGVRETIESLCDELGIPLDDERRAQLGALEHEALVRLARRLVRERRWPE